MIELVDTGKRREDWMMLDLFESLGHNMPRIMNFKTDKQDRVLLQVSETSRVNHFLVTEYKEGKYHTREIRLLPDQTTETVVPE